MKKEKKGSAKESSWIDPGLQTAGMKQRRAKLTLRMVSGKGQLPERKGEKRKGLAVLGKACGKQVIVGEGNYLSVRPKEWKKIGKMVAVGVGHHCRMSVGGGFTDGPGNRLKSKGHEES